MIGRNDRICKATSAASSLVVMPPVPNPDLVGRTFWQTCYLEILHHRQPFVVRPSRLGAELEHHEQIGLEHGRAAAEKSPAVAEFLSLWPNETLSFSLITGTTPCSKSVSRGDGC